MSNRLVLLASLKDFEKFFGMQIDDVRELSPRYNISPGEQIPVIKDEDGAQLKEMTWGVAEGEEHLISADEAVEGLRKGQLERCIIPVSGYYKWKQDGKRSEYPFFIRMLDDPLMALGGVAYPAGKGGKERRCAIVETRSNALIQPLDPHMPLQFDREFSRVWLDEQSDIEELLKEARQLFLMTDMTVLRVSDKVNDPTNNSPDLIQPLPK